MTFAWPLGAAESTLEFYDLSHPWGHGAPAWPYFEDVQIERLHGMAKSRVLTQKITTVMHSGTHIDAPAHVVEGTPFLDEIPLSAFFGTGVVVSIPKGKWGMVTAEDLQNATPDIRPGDIVVVNTGWHHKYADSAEYYAYATARPPTFVLFTTGFLEAGYRRFLERRLRETFGFDGSPIRVNVRVREKRAGKRR